MKDKSNCLTTSCAFYEYCGTLDAPVYQVRDGKITVKGKQYPIKLRDGCYIIRKLTVTECKRLQTVPDEFVFPVSDSQAYKMLGNGWTVDVIAHTVVRGDTLWGLANTYLGNGSRYKEIKTLNGLTSDIIKIGQVLKIPAK